MAVAFFNKILARRRGSRFVSTSAAAIALIFSSISSVPKASADLPACGSKILEYERANLGRDMQNLKRCGYEDVVDDAYVFRRLSDKYLVYRIDNDNYRSFNRCATIFYNTAMNKCDLIIATKKKFIIWSSGMRKFYGSGGRDRGFREDAVPVIEFLEISGGKSISVQIDDVLTVF